MTYGSEYVGQSAESVLAAFPGCISIENPSVHEIKLHSKDMDDSRTYYDLSIKGSGFKHDFMMDSLDNQNMGKVKQLFSGRFRSNIINL